MESHTVNSEFVVKVEFLSLHCSTNMYQNLNLDVTLNAMYRVLCVKDYLMTHS